MKQQLNSLQLYRGVSSILVALHHANIVLDKRFKQDISFNFFHFGWVGVDFFFVLSGFIIFYVHQADIGQPHQFKSFVTKRFLRIYPLYWLVLLTKVFTSLIGWGNIEIQQSNFLQFLQAFLLIPQDQANLEIFIGVSWTLTHEVFFYFMFSLAIIFRSNIFWPIATLWITGMLLNLVGFLPVEESLLLGFVFNTRNLEFVLGCLAAYWVSRNHVNYAQPLIYSSVAMLLASILSTSYREFDTAGLSPVIAYGIPFTLLIIGSVQIEKTTIWKIPAVLLWVGNASYSIYLTHGFFIDKIASLYMDIAEDFKPSLVLSPGKNSHLVFISLLVIASITVGLLIYYYVEKPLLTIFKNKQFNQKNRY